MQLVKIGQSFLAVVRHRDRVALFDQVKPQQFANIFIIVYNENFFVCHRDSILSGGASYTTPLYIR